MAEYYPSDELLDRLRSDTVTNEDVMEFLWGQHNALRDSGQASPPVSMFFNEKTDLQHYAAARAWWPKRPDLPHQFAFPTLYLLCWSYQENHPNIGATFFDRLSIRSNAVVSWLETVGGDASNPNETPEERRKRQNREAQARHRLKSSDAVTPEEREYQDNLKRLHGAWNAAIEKRSEVIADLDQRVREAEAAYHAVCAERREVRSAQDALVAAARKTYLEFKKG